MADTLTVTFDLRYPKRVGGSGKFGIFTGAANITSYDTSKVPVAAIVGHFRTPYRVICDSVSTAGYAIRWDPVAQAFRAYDTGAAAGGVFTEAAVAANVGTFNFLATGLISGAGG